MWLFQFPGDTAADGADLIQGFDTGNLFLKISAVSHAPQVPGQVFPCLAAGGVLTLVLGGEENLPLGQRNPLSQRRQRGNGLTAEGGANPVVANDLTKGVATLYRIPVSSVIVFEKEQEG